MENETNEEERNCIFLFSSALGGGGSFECNVACSLFVEEKNLLQNASQTTTMSNHYRQFFMRAYFHEGEK